MNELNCRGAEWVLVSHGADALWASSNGSFYTFSPARVPVVNPIASRRLLAAGVAWALRAGSRCRKRYGSAWRPPADNATMLLPSRLDLERVRMRTAQIPRQSAPNPDCVRWPRRDARLFSRDAVRQVFRPAATRRRRVARRGKGATHPHGDPREFKRWRRVFRVKLAGESAVPATATRRSSCSAALVHCPASSFSPTVGNCRASSDRGVNLSSRSVG